MAIKAYYNEIDPAAAQWLRNLITAGHIADGIVDERSIEDVLPTDLAGFTQCHFFAGIGVWSLALRRAGWPDDRPVWTGSCPCQPFSAAGKGAGFDDERHLWPAFNHLIQECKPATVFGEQVASKAVEPWIDLVHADLEAMGYAFGCVPFPSAGVGAPHIRDRNYWVGNTNNERSQGHGRLRQVNAKEGRQDASRHSPKAGTLGRLANADMHGRAEIQPGSAREAQAVPGIHRPPELSAGELGRTGGDLCGLADADRDGCEAGCGVRLHGKEHDAEYGGSASTQQPGPTNGLWRAADWLFCRDDKWRPVEPGTFPLVTGAPARVVRLRAYGNAINAKAAQAFIESVMSSC